MFRVDSVVNLKRFDDLLGWAHRYPQYAQRVVKSAFAQAKPSLLNPLRAYPQERARHPFVWSLDPIKNARGRRAYFALVRAGLIKTDDYGYLRTGALGEGYDAEPVIDGDDIFISITNSASRAYKFTKGRRQVPGHAAIWAKDAPIITQWFADFRPVLINELSNAKQALSSP